MFLYGKGVKMRWWGWIFVGLAVIVIIAAVVIYFILRSMNIG